MWNWALNFLSQLMTGSISWLQRSWLCGLSTSRRHDEKGTSAPTITYTLEREEETEKYKAWEKRRENGALFYMFRLRLVTVRAFLLHWVFSWMLSSSKTSAWIFDARLMAVHVGYSPLKQTNWQCLSVLTAKCTHLIHSELWIPKAPIK